MDNDSVLDSVKKGLGIQPDYEHFDPELIMYINSTFSTLHQLGVGPEEPFMIMDKKAKWDTFTNDDAKINSVKQYVLMKVKLIFDSPATSHARTSMENMCKELEWRLNVVAENDKIQVGGEHDDDSKV